MSEPGPVRRSAAGVRWRFVWALPLAWATLSYWALHHPGDEYGLWAAGSLAGIWVARFVRIVGSIWNPVPAVLLCGAAVMALAGLLLDLLRTPRKLWLLLWLGAALLVLVTSLNAYPSYQRAMQKNGSLLAYVLFAANLGLTAASAVALPVMTTWRALQRRPGPGHCQVCGYNLTGSPDERCPECGHPIADARDDPGIRD